MNKFIDNIQFKGENYEFADRELREQFKNISTDESYELIGETPLILTEKSNIKLESAVETSYEVKTPTVWNFDDVFTSGDYTLKNCIVEKENDHYKMMSSETVT